MFLIFKLFILITTLLTNTFTLLNALYMKIAMVLIDIFLQP